jgi:hypothetical protein
MRLRLEKDWGKNPFKGPENTEHTELESRLIALNAAIEAARAGEPGQAFYGRVSSYLQGIGSLFASGRGDKG